jgi:hypothetical protein
VTTPRFLRLLWLAGGLALLLGAGRDPLLGLMPPARELPRWDGATGRAWLDGDFVLEPREQALGAGPLPAHIRRASSWPGTDAWQGRAEGAWFRATRARVYVGVAGYPQREGCRVWAEFRTAAGEVRVVPCPLPNPGEQWSVWEIDRPADAVAVRVSGEDRSSAYTGWIGLSHPYRAWPPALTAAYQFVQYATTIALVLVLVWAPGLMAGALRPGAAAAVRAALLLGTGPLLLAALGVAIWVGGRWLPPSGLALALVTLLWAALGIAFRRWPAAGEPDRDLQRSLLLSALLVTAVGAKSAYSTGPQGELFRGTVSRNFALSDRLDSRFGFLPSQAAAHRRGPTDPRTEAGYAPWTFFSRGPLAGLAAIPVVLATGGEPPDGPPDQRWQPFDPAGFAAYRVVMITLASGVIVALHLMLAPLVGGAWAGLGAGLLALTPFAAHEMLFTWPKWPATAWVALSFMFAHAQRPGGAGLALGVGFLFHPLALLWAPWLALWAAVRRDPRPRLPWLRAGAMFALGAGAIVLPWMALGAWAPHGTSPPLAGQAGFLRYVLLADGHTATWSTWWHTRWLNFANTFVPFHGYLAEASFHHPRFGSVHMPSGALEKFAQLWWTSLPLAAGAGVWAVGGAALLGAGRALAAPVVLFVVGPALLLVGYWGMDPLGLMRECGHPLLLAWIALAVVAAARRGGALAAWWRHPATPWLQLPETWLMLWLTALANPMPAAADYRQLDGVYFTVNVLALGGAAWLATRLRRHLPPPPAAGVSDAALPPRRGHGATPAPRTVVVLAAAGVGGLLLVAQTLAQRCAPAFPDLGVATEGGFARDGHFPGERLDGAGALRFWGSWSGDDAHTGRLALGPFPAPVTLRFAVGGYPTRPGNALWIERVDTLERQAITLVTDIGERWRREEVHLPAGWVGAPVRIVAQDDARQLGGWFALSEPWRGGFGTGPAELLATLAAWTVNGLLLGCGWFAALRFLHRRMNLPAAWLALAATGLVALAGYLVFWVHFVHAVAGQVLCLLLLAAGIHGTLRRESGEGPLPADATLPGKLAVATGLACLALLHLYPSALDFHTLAANRFGALPGDNTLPHNTARSLFRGVPLKEPGADWLSSDRPPLQAGWLLLARPVTTRLGLDERTVDGTAAVWLQLAWVAAAWGLLRTLGVTRPRAAAATALLAGTGFFLLNTVYTWPKLGAAAFMVGAFAFWQRTAATPAPAPVPAPAAGGRSGSTALRETGFGGLLAALAWLAHGGVAFSLLALAPWVAFRAWRHGWRPWLGAALVFALLALPWMAYQKWYDPPGNRLLKWHLGGQIDKDPRGTWETIRDGYRALSWEEILRRRASNLELQVAVGGSWWRDFSAARATDRRNEEFFRSGRALNGWLFGLAAVPFLISGARRRRNWIVPARLAAWALGTILLWCGLMFMATSAFVHQGSYAALLVLFALLAAACARAGGWALALVGTFQLVSFATTWVPPTPALREPWHPAALAVLLAALAALVGLVVREARRRAPE